QPNSCLPAWDACRRSEPIQSPRSMSAMSQAAARAARTEATFVVCAYRSARAGKHAFAILLSRSPATHAPAKAMKNPHSQSGVMLLEVLIGMLLFLIGIVGIVSLQAASAKHTTDAKYRTEAAYLANAIIGRM